MSTADDIVVIAVGIDFPEDSTLWATAGLARRALDFAETARSRGVPRQSIYLMTAGDDSVIADAERRDSAVEKVFDADAKSFSELVEIARRHADCDSVVVYWTGHGAIGRDGDRCLLFADASSEGRCVSDKELIAHLMAATSDKRESPFTRIMLVADVCANRRPSLTKSPLLSDGRYDDEFERVAFYATVHGEYASANSGFSPAIMNWLAVRPVSDWWDIRLHEVRNLYHGLKADNKGQQPFACYVKTRDGEDDLQPEPDTPRHKGSDLPSDPYLAYHIDPKRTYPSWTPWETNAIPLNEQALVRLDVVFTARRSVFRAMVIEKDGVRSLADDLPGIRPALTESSKGQSPIALREWRNLDTFSRRELQTLTGDRLDALFEPIGSDKSILRGVLLSVHDPDRKVDWAEQWRVLHTNVFRDYAVVVVLAADSTLDGVHTALAAAEKAMIRGIAVEVYSRSVPTGPEGVDHHGYQPDGGPIAAVRREVASRRQVLATRGRAKLRRPVAPHIVPIEVVREIADALNADALDYAQEVVLLRSIRENLHERWTSMVMEYAKIRSTPGWVAGLEVAAEIRSDLVCFLRELGTRRDRVLEHPNTVTGWLTTQLIDQLGMELRHLTLTPDSRPSYRRGWQVWQRRMTAAVRDAIEQGPAADWGNLTAQQLVMLSRHGYPAPEAAQDAHETVRWVSVAQSPATAGLARLLELGAGAFAAAVFDADYPDRADPEWVNRLAGLRNAVRPKS
ncbi:hypothetical protein [Nocardia sp. CS682]|uniref:hypothetical protein n=1 Tax=Nocardia sp. CS682 TaxID=1047172 RepID=UPI0010756F20|nr:hypothetical protein [Nocardia sp. CS682]QBS44923.1 hypothetical protein DMB37_37420 [Nocardia sp. CS682]